MKKRQDNSAMRPLVSVLMPVYNGLPMIKASLGSLLDQTYDNWECIIVDDGSDDGTAEYLDSLQDARFKVCHFDKNCGRPIARQKTLELARGKYIAILDADDIYAPTKLQKQVAMMESHPEVDLCTCLTCAFGTRTEEVRIRGDRNQEPLMFHKGRTFAHGTCVFRADKAKKITYNPCLKLGQDFDFIQRYLDGGKYISVDEVLFYYNEYDSVTKKKIRRTYRLLGVQNLAKGHYRNAFVFLAKYVVSAPLFAFMSTQSILNRRGREASEAERAAFTRECRDIINKYT